MRAALPTQEMSADAVNTMPLLDRGPTSVDPSAEWVRRHQTEQLRKIMLETTREIEIPEGLQCEF